MYSKDLSAALLRDIANIYKGADDYNLQIIVGEEPNTEVFKAHSVILRARSSYFHAALSNNWVIRDGDMMRFKKPNISPDVFRIILKYIYTGTISLDPSNGEINYVELLTAADELTLTDLVDYIQDHIINMDRIWFQRNIVQVFNTVSCHEVLFRKLLDHCTKIIINDPKILFTSGDFGQLNEDALLSIISQDTLRMKEIQIWEYLLKWGLAQSNMFDLDPKNWSPEEFQELEKVLHNSISHIRFFQLSCNDYYYKIRPYKKLLPKELRENLKLFFIIPNSIPKSSFLPPRIPKLALDSTIIDTKRAALLCSWVDHREGTSLYLPHENPYNLKLLLRGTRDGFSVEDFKKRCFNQGPTLVVIQSGSSNSSTGLTRSGQIIIGGYNPSSWSGSNKFTHSTESFIFSLCSDAQSHITTLSRVIVENDAISDDDSQFIGFGHGDLYIFKGSCQKRDYMYGILDKTKFTMDELEVFQVVKGLDS
ncbi:4837_t:CDS:2 [Acaulospora morrowiae]|uniref:4837_t:CDS:1 n=1 Tax=Acaulospora morrowiae TaxID=94023 RepID=A0A9N8YV00_9GLOM|nr:4837_t:CDS:2 [Acaulospora morrowiae]